ncbi:MAG: aldehyde dehydrogenase family protein [Roseitalea sp.]|jgi:aldehyde dehydrogenase (NAD+)|nr:aldehyde dehydrogenase family protein [Roseitalea sp.]MBO6722671.1 aldehyde dehydrogenase family protein [Roseitalea sp.]MBO6741545.1 aldehyde dehydrogenase family protein [Roseitalea sp.]
MVDPKMNVIGAEMRGVEFSPNLNPSDQSDVVGEYASGSAKDVEEAVAAAREAFASWSHSGTAERHGVLRRASDEILARKDELGRLLAREEGKTLAEATAEVGRAAQIFDFFSGEVLRLSGEVIPSVRPGIKIEVTRDPVGVVGLITPWNFPIAIPAWKLAPAIAYGNTTILKPADLVPACAWELVDIVRRAGAPSGVVNLVMGRGSVVGQAMLDHPGIDAISFTGSQETGKRVAEASIAVGRRFQLEMGGKNPLVILDDANLDVAVQCALNGAFFSTGQRCTASSRLIATEGIHDAFVDALKSAMAQCRVGHALDPETSIGPVASSAQLHQDMDYIDIGRAEGAELVQGGERINAETEGFFLTPALFTQSSNTMRISREEIFGPVASVIKAQDYEHALHLANDTEMGLVAGICTTALKHAEHFKRHAEAGMVMVNLPTAGVDFHVPFGGRKGSSFGPREQGRYAAEFFTHVKTSYTQP